MAKIIKYEIQSGEELLLSKIPCKTQADYDANYPIAESEAVGEIIVEGEFDEVIEPTAQDDTDAMLVDHEYRLTLLELGITE